MLFAPITARSFRVRALYASVYGLLALGAVTMIAPFLIMISGSVEPRSQAGDVAFFPSYLVDKKELWERYLEAKYHGIDDYLRMAWSAPGLFFRDTGPDLAGSDGKDMVPLWQEFLAEQKPAATLFTMGFLRPNTKMPAYSGLAFRDWLLEKYGSLEGVNSALGTAFNRPDRINPPHIRIDGASLPNTPFLREFFTFMETRPVEQKFAWDAGGYFRTHILPRLVDRNIAAYNSRFGTSYKSYAEVPFPSTVPEIGGDLWFFFVSKLLRTDFVGLTDQGKERLAASGIAKDDFIRVRAEPADLRVVSADTLFSDWAASRGVPDARIPQQELDRQAFAGGHGFWRSQFLTLNYRVVLDAIMGHGGAIRNTLILVVLSVGGALLINPLAAYALSRYKLKSSYHILLFCLATIAFPGEVTMIPIFLQLKDFNLLNTFGALILPGLANGFSIFLLKGFFDSLPRELYEAAELDGAGELTMFWTVTMNLSKPILAVIALQTFVSAYGTFFFALILAPDPAIWTVMVYVYQLRQSVAPPVVYASLIITAIPTLIVFITCQNVILRGIVVPSDK